MGEAIIQQQSFLEKFHQLVPVEVSRTLQEYIQEFHLQNPSQDNFDKIVNHAKNLSTTHTAEGKF